MLRNRQGQQFKPQFFFEVASIKLFKIQKKLVANFEMVTTTHYIALRSQFKVTNQTAMENIAKVAIVPKNHSISNQKN
jgi:hypothetical protein